MEPSHARSPEGTRVPQDIWPRGNAGRRLTCILTPLHPERALSNALVQHLSQEMPDIQFTLKDLPDPDVVWVCGFESGAEALVRDLRVRKPDAFLVVTGRGSMETWKDAVRASGADYCCGWPIPVQELSRILHSPVRRARI